MSYGLFTIICIALVSGMIIGRPTAMARLEMSMARAERDGYRCGYSVGYNEQRVLWIEHVNTMVRALCKDINRLSVERIRDHSKDSETYTCAFTLDNQPSDLSEMP